MKNTLIVILLALSVVSCRSPRPDATVSKTLESGKSTSQGHQPAGVEIIRPVLPAGWQADYSRPYRYTTSNGTVTIRRYIGSNVTPAIPAAINDLPVTSIGSDAFRGIASLISVTIPASVIDIGNGDGAFVGCTNLTAITVDPGNSVYCSVDGVLFNRHQTVLLRCPEGKAGTYTVSNSVASIGAYAFANCLRLPSITMGDSVTNIEFEAFLSCASLTNVTMGNNVTRLGDFSFSGCASLASVTIPDSVTSIGYEAFNYCTNLTCVTIGSSVTNIGSAAFFQCSNLTSVSFKGNAPTLVGSPFDGGTHAIVYYLPGTTGWGSGFGGLPLRCEDFGRSVNRPSPDSGMPSSGR